MRGADPVGDQVPDRIGRRDRLPAGLVRTVVRDPAATPGQLLIVFTEAMTFVCNAAGSGAAPREDRVACPSVAV